MIALCPNCHALKTRGKNRQALTETLLDAATRIHAQVLASI
jgi:5-methylcytosine-specific restriction protein A